MRRTGLCCVALAVFLTLSPAPARADLSQFAALLTGDEEVPPVATEGFSVAFLSFQRFFGSDRLITVRFNFGTLSGPVTAAHIHTGAVGVNGPVVVNYATGSLVNTTFLNININDGSDLVGPLAGQTLNDLRAVMEEGNAYINVHTAEHPGGEIRGQIQSND